MILPGETEVVPPSERRALIRHPVFLISDIRYLLPPCPRKQFTSQASP